VRLDLSTPPVALRQALVFSPPCWLVQCAAADVFAARR
jgi:hypothetical protein